MAGSRPEYTTVKMRAGDLQPGDVTHNKYGRWAVVKQILPTHDPIYVTVKFDVPGELELRNVHLATVQKPKPEK